MMSEVSGEPVDESAAESTAVPPASADASEPGKPNLMLWAIGLAVSGVLAVLAINNSPEIFKLPPEYLGVDPSAPQDVQEAASVAYTAKEFKNGLIAYALAGICLAVPCVVAARRHALGSALGYSAVGLIFGGICGLLAAGAATLIHQKMRAAGYDIESMTPDIIAWSAMSAFLTLPAALSLVIGGERFTSQRVASTPLAGILTGIVVTIGVSLWMPNSNTAKIPPFGYSLTAVWFGVLVALILALALSTGSRKKAETTAS